MPPDPHGATAAAGRARAPGAASRRAGAARPRGRRRPRHGRALRDGAVGPGRRARGATGQRARGQRPARAAAGADGARTVADRPAARAHRDRGAGVPALDRRPAGRGAHHARARARATGSRCRTPGRARAPISQSPAASRASASWSSASTDVRGLIGRAAVGGRRARHRTRRRLGHAHERTGRLAGRRRHGAHPAGPAGDPRGARAARRRRAAHRGRRPHGRAARGGIDPGRRIRERAAAARRRADHAQRRARSSCSSTATARAAMRSRRSCTPTTCRSSGSCCRACACTSSSSSPRCAGTSRSSVTIGAVRGAPAPYPFTRAGRLCVLLALAKVALLVPILGRYGWDRDELYFLAAGRHLAFGYVDFPPLTALAARLVDGTIGPSLISLRLLCSLMAVVAAVAAGAIARELGAGQRLQVLAAAAWIADAVRPGRRGAVPPDVPRARRDGARASGRGAPRGSQRAAAVVHARPLGRHRPRGQVHDRRAAGCVPGGLRAVAPRPAAPRGGAAAC